MDNPKSGMKHRSVIALGSNLGDRSEYIRRAVDLWRSSKGVNLLKVSGIYETDPVGENLSSDFLNCCIAVDVSISPRDLLEACLNIEKNCGRIRSEGGLSGTNDRTMDCDMIFYGDETIGEKGLKIPHPRWAERLFVVRPMNDIRDFLTEWQRERLDGVLAGFDSSDRSCRLVPDVVD